MQGQSGSPIIQNGKLAGALTHVFVDQCSKGYGIFAENMLNRAEIAAGECSNSESSVKSVLINKIIGTVKFRFLQSLYIST